MGSFGYSRISNFVDPVKNQTASSFKINLLLFCFRIVFPQFGVHSMFLQRRKHINTPLFSSILCVKRVNIVIMFMMKGDPVVGKYRIRGIIFPLILNNNNLDSFLPQFINKLVKFFESLIMNINRTRLLLVIVID